MILVILGILIVIAVIECWLLEVEHWGWATATLLATLIGVHVLHVVDVWGFITHNALHTTLYVLGYLAVGVVWSFVKWFSFLVGFRDAHREAKAQWMKRNNIAPDQMLTENQSIALSDYMQYQSWHKFHGVYLNKRPTAVTNKRRITAWMSFWPFSMAGTIINDPIRRLFRLLFDTLKGLYQQIADHVFRNETDLK